MILVRRAGQKDIGPIHAIEEACSSAPWSRGQLAEELYQDFAHLLLAEEKGEILGFADLHVVSDDAHVNEIGVREDARRRGIGSALMERMLDVCRRKGAVRVSLEVRTGNLPAIGLYEKYGFRTAGRRKNFYRDPAEDGYTMVREMGEERPVLLLGVESSCDETSCAVVRDGREMLSNVVATQIAEHRLYGGVVPEIASRRHIENIVPVCRKALEDAGVTLEDLDAVAVTCAPGLIGALLAGLSFAKGLCYGSGLPLVPVHHLRGHIASLYLSNPELEPPFVALVVSGGHTHTVLVKGYTEFRVLGRAVDDAAGEAFDKVARTLGLPYPGGPEISKLAKEGDPSAYHLPTPHVSGAYDVSFSGLKTAVLNLVNSAAMKGEEVRRADLAAALEQKATGSLAERLIDAAAEHGLPAAVCGGVSVNGELQRKAAALAKKRGIRLWLPERQLCGDNGAMIASAGYYEYLRGKTAPLSQNAYATYDIDKEL